MSNLQNQYTNGLHDFVDEMVTSILHEGAMPLYRSKRRYPVDQQSSIFSVLRGDRFL
jgi:hypothetical protein